MKSFHYCGAAIVGGAVPFYAECGKPLPRRAEVSLFAQKLQSSTANPRSTDRRPSKKKQSSPSAKCRESKPKLERSHKKKAQKQSETLPESDPCDENYDGYYNDIEPIDRDRTRDHMDSKLVKRIVIMTASAFFIVILAIVVMSLL